MKKPTVVSHLLEHGQGMLQRLREGTADAERTCMALKSILPAELAEDVWSAVLREKTLTVFVRSAAWGTRLRYVMPGIADMLAARLGTAIDEIKVKVRARP
ncbi:MAG: DciA family protein [Steroidobacteraceae bacterium]